MKALPSVRSSIFRPLTSLCTFPIPSNILFLSLKHLFSFRLGRAMVVLFTNLSLKPLVLFEMTAFHRSVIIFFISPSNYSLLVVFIFSFGFNTPASVFTLFTFLPASTGPTMFLFLPPSFEPSSRSLNYVALAFDFGSDLDFPFVFIFVFRSGLRLCVPDGLFLSTLASQLGCCGFRWVGKIYPSSSTFDI